MSHNSRAQAGFSLSELLVSLAILSLLTGLVATGIPVARRAYVSIVDRSNADVLLSTTLVRIRSELDTATAVAVDGTGAVTGFTSGKTGYASMLKNADQRGIVLEEERPNESDSVQTPLVSERAATNGLHASFDSISYEDGAFVLANIRVLDRHGAELTSIDQYRVETLIHLTPR